MKKSKILSAVFIILSIILICWSTFMVGIVTGTFNGDRTSWSSNNPALIGVTKTNDHYNISLAFTNVTLNEELYNILINPNSSNEITGLTAYLNGTALNPQDPIRCSLQKGDSLQVDFVFPCINFEPQTCLHIVVMGDSFGCGGQVILP